MACRKKGIMQALILLYPAHLADYSQTPPGHPLASSSRQTFENHKGHRIAKMLTPLRSRLQDPQPLVSLPPSLPSSPSQIFHTSEHPNIHIHPSTPPYPNSVTTPTNPPNAINPPLIAFNHPNLCTITFNSSLSTSSPLPLSSSAANSLNL